MKWNLLCILIHNFPEVVSSPLYRPCSLLPIRCQFSNIWHWSLVVFNQERIWSVSTSCAAPPPCVCVFFILILCRSRQRGKPCLFPSVRVRRRRQRMRVWHQTHPALTCIYLAAVTSMHLRLSRSVLEFLAVCECVFQLADSQWHRYWARLETCGFGIPR